MQENILEIDRGGKWDRAGSQPLATLRQTQNTAAEGYKMVRGAVESQSKQFECNDKYERL